MDDDIKETFLQKALEYDFIRFTVADMHGISKGKVVPARNTASYAKKGPQWWTGRGFFCLMRIFSERELCL